MERVGFVGLGIMGSPMARNAIKAGFPVTVTNRTLDRAKPLEQAGATVVRTPKEVAERSDLVVTMVTSSPDVDAVIFWLSRLLLQPLPRLFSSHLRLHRPPSMLLVWQLVLANLAS